jgi:predicted enzyme related to lactoylglutathione lyase
VSEVGLEPIAYASVLSAEFALGSADTERAAAPGSTSSPSLNRRWSRPRIHLDLTVDDIDDAVVAVVQAGGRATGERHDYAEGIVVVMADPEGNEFCLVRYFT